MRCNNCGWDNPINQLYCEKCKVPLQGASVSNRPPEPGAGNAPVSGTIKGAASDQQYLDVPADNTKVAATEDSKTRYCSYPGCGYPLLPGATVCPKCNTPVDLKSQSPAEPPTNKAVPGKKGSSAAGTITI